MLVYFPKQLPLNLLRLVLAFLYNATVLLSFILSLIQVSGMEWIIFVSCILWLILEWLWCVPLPS